MTRYSGVRLVCSPANCRFLLSGCRDFDPDLPLPEPSAVCLGSGTRLYRDPPHIPLAVALGRHLRVAPEVEMNDPALVRRHRFEHDGSSAPRYLARNPLCQTNQGLFTPGAVTLDVDDHAGPIAQLAVNQQVHHVLNLGQILAPA